MRARRAGRRGFRRSRLLISLALTAAFLAVPGSIYAWGSRASAFQIRHIRVEGAERVSAQRSVKLLRQAFLSHNLFTVRSAEVERVLQPLVFLASVEVDRDFPSTLVVHLTEHTPALYVLSTGSWYLVSDEGRVLAAIGRERRKVAVALRGGPPKAALRLPFTATAGSLRPRTDTTDTAVRDALAVLRTASPRLRQQLVLVRSTAKGLRLRTRAGAVVELGSRDELSAKCAAVEAVLSFYERRRIRVTYIDAVVPDRPVARPDV